MDTQRIVTRSKLVADLRQLGLRPSDVVMVHESVKSIGWIVGGPDVVLDALCEVLGREGTLMKLVGSEDGMYEAARWPEQVRRAYEQECPAFDAQRTRACRQFGLLTEYLRTRPGAYRSDHPDCSMAAVGKLGAWLTAKHPLSHGMGDGSPLAKLVQADGKVLLLGSPLANTTLLHLAEYRAKLPNKRIVRYQTPIYRNGVRTLVEIEELDSDGGVVEWNEDGDYFERIVRAFLDAGKGRTGLVGYAESHLVSAAELVSFGVAWMEAHLVAG